MHETIGAIVAGATKKDAESAAESIFETLVSNGHFDYYDRDNEYSQTLQAASPKGRKVIDDLWSTQEREFRDNMKEVRAGVDHLTDEQLLSGEKVGSGKSFASDPNMIRHFMYRAGEYQGASVALYDRLGSGIRSKKDLKDALEGEGSEETLWVVTTDVHH